MQKCVTRTSLRGTYQPIQILKDEFLILRYSSLINDLFYIYELLGQTNHGQILPGQLVDQSDWRIEASQVT